MANFILPPYPTIPDDIHERPKIFDPLRRKHVALTPEEWVRQSFIRHLVNELGYPAALLANEVPLQVGNKKLRADSVLYDRALKPKMIIEYKAPDVAITQKVFDQITTYNLLLHVDYLIVTNGIDTYLCKMDYDNASYTISREIVHYENI